MVAFAYIELFALNKRLLLRTRYSEYPIESKSVILNSITLHNFMSYVDATLDFSAATVACLAGQNGAGKSALLDAITWALWESARASSDELIRLGEKEMWIDLTFTHEGRRYRVRRSRQLSSSKSGGKITSKGQLEFQVYESAQDTAFETPGTNGETRGQLIEEHGSASFGRGVTTLAQTSTEGGRWRSLTASSMRETQKHICDLLRMDFDTFVNSAYLRQGRADEFTTRGPLERKQVLSEILGLSYFDQLQERAREKYRDLKAKGEFLATTLQNLPDVQNKLQENDLELERAQIDYDKIVLETDECEVDYQKLQAKAQELNLVAQKLVLGEEQAKQLEADIINLSQQNEDLTARVKNIDELLSCAHEIEFAKEQFDKLKESLAALDSKALAAEDLLNKRMESQSDLARLRSKLEVDAEHSRTIVGEIETKHAKLLKETHDSDRIETAHAQFKQSLAEEAELARKQEDFARLTNRVNELQSFITEARIRLEAEIGQKQLLLQDLQSMLLGKNLLDEEQQRIEQETEALEKVEAQFELVEERGMKAKTDLQSAQLKIEDLKGKKQENLVKIQELKDHCDSSICPLCSSPIVDRAAVISRYHKSNEAHDSEIAKTLQEIAQLEDDRQLLRKEYLDLKRRMDDRKALDKQIGQFNEKIGAYERAEANCSKLAGEVQYLHKQFDNQDYALIERESLINVKAEIHKLEFDPLVYANLQSQIRMQRHIESRYQQLIKDQNELAKVEAELPRLKEKLTALTNELEGESYGSEIRTRLQTIKDELAKLEYDRQAHAEMRNQLSDLMPKTELYRDLIKARQDRPLLEESAKSCVSLLTSKNQQREHLRKDLEDGAEKLKELPSTRERIDETEPRLQVLKEQKEELAKMVAVLDSQSKAFKEELNQFEKQSNELDRIKAEAEDYAFLAEAFGKKGIQAVIIENAIPEIESEANRILSRLTNNTMHVALVTQHKNKSGGTIETLDLLIADDMGTRNYELYSGGEAFKVNFAIRVALSRLLARRSGAKLETLIIDEGFGSQDEESRDRLVRAIRSIQSDFARILVITHISDIREMFPVHIQVSKVNGHSQLQVVC